jgi:hypothetical protein
VSAPDSLPPHLVAVMHGVREITEGLPVELWRDKRGRLVIRAYNEAGCRFIDLDLWDILDWLSAGGGTELMLDSRKGTGADRNDSRGD